MHVVFNEIIPNPTNEYFAELEQLKIDVASESCDPADYQFLVGTQHIDVEDGLVYETTGVIVRKGYIVAYCRRGTTVDSMSWEEWTSIYKANVTARHLSPPI